MKAVHFIFSEAQVAQAVKQETSLMAVRLHDKEGTRTLLDDLVLDEAYQPKFRELFMDARVRITDSVSAYLRDMPAAAESFDEQDFSARADYELTLYMPDNWNYQLAESVNSLMTEYFVAYITFRWLETKYTDFAPTFAARADGAKAAITKLLNKRRRFFQRPNVWY